MEYTQVPSDAFQKMGFNAGFLCTGFTPSTGAVTGLVGATTGGITIASNPNYVDFGKDVDNVPPNTWQLKRIISYDPSISGTLLSVDNARLKSLIGGAEYGVSGTGQSATEDTTHIIPKTELAEADFSDLYFVGDYSDKNNGTGSSGTYAGYIVVHLKKAFNNVGLKIKTEKDGKMQFSFEYHGHYDLTDIEDVPYEVYIRSGNVATT